MPKESHVRFLLVELDREARFLRDWLETAEPFQVQGHIENPALGGDGT